MQSSVVLMGVRQTSLTSPFRAKKFVSSFANSFLSSKFLLTYCDIPSLSNPIFSTCRSNFCISESFNAFGRDVMITCL